MKFKYCDKVKIVGGFYEGQRGIVEDVRGEVRYRPNKKWFGGDICYYSNVYSIVLTTDCVVYINVEEEYLEKLGNKK